MGSETETLSSRRLAGHVVLFVVLAGTVAWWAAGRVSNARRGAASRPRPSPSEMAETPKRPSTPARAGVVRPEYDSAFARALFGAEPVLPRSVLEDDRQVGAMLIEPRDVEPDWVFQQAMDMDPRQVDTNPELAKVLEAPPRMQWFLGRGDTLDNPMRRSVHVRFWRTASARETYRRVVTIAQGANFAVSAYWAGRVAVEITPGIIFRRVPMGAEMVNRFARAVRGLHPTQRFKLTRQHLIGTWAQDLWMTGREGYAGKEDLARFEKRLGVSVECTLVQEVFVRDTREKDWRPASIYLHSLAGPDANPEQARTVARNADGGGGGGGDDGGGGEWFAKDRLVVGIESPSKKAVGLIVRVLDLER